jgi:hypothetical protein
MAKPLSKQNPLEKMMHVSPFVSSEPVLFEVAKSVISKEYNLQGILHISEDKPSSSSSSIEFEPLPAGPEYVVLDHDQDQTMISHNESLEMENPWVMEFCEAPTLKSGEKDSINKHGSFIVEMTQEPCSFNASSEFAMLCARACTRTTTTLRSSLVKSLGGWL